MAQVIHTGLNGSASGVPGKIFTWMGVRSHEDLDETGFGDIERVRTTGLGDFVGRILAYVTSGSAADTFDTLSNTPLVPGLVLTSKTGCTFTFDAIISDIDFQEVDINGRRAQVCSFTFKKTGALAIAWAKT